MGFNDSIILFVIVIAAARLDIIYCFIKNTQYTPHSLREDIQSVRYLFVIIFYLIAYLSSTDVTKH